MPRNSGEIIETQASFPCALEAYGVAGVQTSNKRFTNLVTWIGNTGYYKRVLWDIITLRVSREASSRK